ncbi:MAG: FmdB family transcriptional regulator [Actinobacteria bacterium]|nr:MAG: FmdB family transcriptional regulator [Actinomycetota bacterium]
MPTYEYQCLSCGRHTEAQQSFSDEPLRKCPHCGGPLRRVFHPVGIVLKGSGFYSTDNRGSKRASESKSESKKESGAETKSESTKSDSSSSSSSGESKTASKKDSGSSKGAPAKKSD